jgi:hypothetical protein
MGNDCSSSSYVWFYREILYPLSARLDPLDFVMLVKTCKGAREILKEPMKARLEKKVVFCETAHPMWMLEASRKGYTRLIVWKVCPPCVLKKALVREDDNNAWIKSIALDFKKQRALRKAGVWDASSACNAADIGDVSLLDFMIRNGCAYDCNLCRVAVVRGHSHVLLYAEEECLFDGNGEPQQLKAREKEKKVRALNPKANPASKVVTSIMWEKELVRMANHHDHFEMGTWLCSRTRAAYSARKK